MSDVARQVVVLDERWAHHSPHSGYCRFVQRLPGIVAVRCVVRGKVSVEIRKSPQGDIGLIWAGERALKVPLLELLIRKALTTRYWYPVEPLLAEVRLLARMRWSSRTIYHLTYAEEQFGLLGRAGWPDRCRVIATFHQPPSILWASFRDHDALRRLDAAIAVSSNQLDVLHDLFGPNRVFLVPHGIDADYWSPAHGPPPPKVKRTVLSVGHWLRDWDTLEVVVHDLRRALGDNLDIVVVTSAEQADRLANWPGVNVLTGISEAALREWYRRADVTLLPLTDGTVNNAMLESLASGTPVVVTNVGAVRDLAPDGLGILAVPASDPPAMTRAALSVLEGVDYQQRSRSARESAERLDWSRVSKNLLDAYRRVAVGA